MKSFKQMALLGLFICGTTAWAEVRTLAQVREDIWSSLTNRFFDARTEMLYDVMWRLPNGGESATALLPTADEIARQYPNPCAWGVGQQDCVFNGTPMLLAALRAGNRELAYATYRGLKRCAEVSGVPGFVARGVSPRDGKGYYINSSRDTFSLFVYGMLKFHRHPFADAATRADIARLLVDVARFAERCVVPEHAYSLLRSDGGRALVSRMWVVDPKAKPQISETGWANVGGLCPHETLRLSMFYAAAHAVTGDAHWRELELKYADDGIHMAEHPIGRDIRGSVLGQMQLSVRLLWECETDAARKDRYARLLARGADLAETCVMPRMVAKAACEGWSFKTSALADWRPYVLPNHKDRMVLDGLAYEVMNHPAPAIEEPYVELAHAVIVQSLAPGRTLSPALAKLFVQVVSKIDFGKAVTANQVNALLATYVLPAMKNEKESGK